MKYSVKITHQNKQVSYLSHKGKIEWNKRQAKKHSKEWNDLNESLSVIEEN